jgi:raffinose/stachyose/melibiose transport system substrate-binding protein
VDQPRMSRRRLMQVLALGGAGALSACAAPGARSGPGGRVAARGIPTSPVEGDVSFAHWRAEDKAVFDKLIAAFTTKNAEVKIRQDISPSNDYQSNALQRIRGGKIGDVFVSFRGAQFFDMAKAGIYAPIAGQPLVANYDPALINAGSQLGSLLGLPYQVVFNMPVANMDALADAGVAEAPDDWDGFLAMCDKLKAKGLVPLAWPGGDIANAGQLLNSMVMNNAPTDDMFTRIESGQAKVTDPWFLTTLKQYVQLRPYFQPNATGTATEPAEQLFAKGKAGLLLTGSFHMAAVRKLCAKFPMNLVPPITVPAEKAKFQGIYNATFILGVNTAGNGQDAALKWLEFLSDPVNAAVYANGTAQHVTVKDVDYTNADLKHNAPWLEKKTLLAPRFQFNNLDIRAAVEAACVAVVGGASPEQAAAQAQGIVDQKRK